MLTAKQDSVFPKNVALRRLHLQARDLPPPSLILLKLESGVQLLISLLSNLQGGISFQLFISPFRIW